MKHDITILSTRAKNLPPAQGLGWRYHPARACPRCSCGWLGDWKSPKEAVEQGQRHSDPYGIKAEAAVDAHQESKTPRWRR